MKKRICVMLVMALLACFAMTGCGAQQAEEPLPALDASSIALLNRPAVLMMQTIVECNYTFEHFTVDGTALRAAIQTEMDNRVANGLLDASNATKMADTYVRYFVSLVGDYCNATGKVDREKIGLTAMGTGFIITPDGYILTNAHVVDVGATDVAVYLATNEYVDLLTSMPSEIMSYVESAYGVKLTSAQQNMLINAMYAEMRVKMNLTDLQVRYSCMSSSVDESGAASPQMHELQLIDKGQAIPGKDVAIMKVDGNNLPTVALGNDTYVKSGDDVYAMGYPYVATYMRDILTENSAQEPTVTRGIISARKTMSDGWEVFQTDVDIHPGNSGGPLFNADGEVIGLNTFRSIDSDTGSGAAGMNFAVPISIANEFLSENGITARQSEFSAEWRRAVDAYRTGNYIKAEEILQPLYANNPHYAAVAELLRECSQKAAQQRAQNPPAQEINMMVVYIAVGAVLLIAVLLVVLLAANSKKKKARQLAGYGASGYGQPGMPAGPSGSPYAPSAPSQAPVAGAAYPPAPPTPPAATSYATASPTPAAPPSYTPASPTPTAPPSYASTPPTPPSYAQTPQAPSATPSQPGYGPSGYAQGQQNSGPYGAPTQAAGTCHGCGAPRQSGYTSCPRCGRPYGM